MAHLGRRLSFFTALALGSLTRTTFGAPPEEPPASADDDTEAPTTGSVEVAATNREHPTTEEPAATTTATTTAATEASEPPDTSSRGGLSAPPSAPSPEAKLEPRESGGPPGSEKFRLHGAPGKGATVELGEAFSLNVKTRIQVRYQLDAGAEDATGSREVLQTVNIGTARLWFSGHAFSRDLTYMVQLAVADRDYRDGATSPIYDAFLDYRAHRDFSVKVGQYFVPFDRLRTVREFALQLADRPAPVQQLTLDRDVGVTFYSDSFLADDSPVAVRLGAFGGGGTNLSLGKEPGALVVGRVELRPLGKIDDDSEGDLERRAKPALALGAGVARNWNTNRVRSTTGPTYEAGVVDYLHAAIDLVFKWRGLAVQGEFLWRQADQNVLVGSSGAYSQSGRGWITQASYTFDPPFELVGRLSGIEALEGTDPRFVEFVEAQGREVAAGVNYYLNGHKFKIQADLVAKMPSSYDLARATQAAHVQLDVTF